MPVRQLRLLSSPSADADLLTRFVEEGDAEAFAELVRRHAGMVCGVCRRALGSTADADDAFQAVFLVFVRKARVVLPRSLVGNFLYGVAHRTAAHVRADRARRAARFRDLPDMPAAAPHVADAEQLAALDDELTRLPDVYRAAVVLCELEGLSLKEAAGRLKLPAGTLASRLARGRKLLAGRLARRGLAGLLALAAAEGASAAVPRKLLEQVIAGGGPVPVVELAHGVLKAMLITKLSALGRMVVGVGAAVLLLAAAVTADESKAEPTAAAKAPAPDGVKADDDVKTLYDQLGDTNADKVLAAALKMIARPKEATAYLKTATRQLKVDDKSLDGWVAALTGNDEKKEEEAVKELMALSTNPKASRRLFAAMRATDDQDTRRRLAAVALSSWGAKRDRIDGRTVIEFGPRADDEKGTIQSESSGGRTMRINFPDDTDFTFGPDKAQRQLVRAVMVLERIGTSEAMAVLKNLAEEDEELPATAAKEALERLKAK